MNGKEQKRLKVLNDLEAGMMTMVQASKALGLSMRHVYRLRARYRREGAPALAHGNRGMASDCLPRWLQVEKDRPERLLGKDRSGLGERI